MLVKSEPAHHFSAIPLQLKSLGLTHTAGSLGCVGRAFEQKASHLTHADSCVIVFQLGGSGSGGGGFFLACVDFGRMLDPSFPACAAFFFFKVKISSRTLIPLFRPGSVHSGSAS